MNKLAKIISMLALAAMIVPCLLLVAGAVDQSTVKSVALIGTLAWFIATPVWMGRELPIDATEVEI